MRDYLISTQVTWCGGITEARRVVAMAAADDVLVVPHGSSVYAYHLQYAFPNCPVAEFINLSPPVWKSKFTARSWRCRLITTRHTG